MGEDPRLKFKKFDCISPMFEIRLADAGCSSSYSLITIISYDNVSGCSAHFSDFHKHVSGMTGVPSLKNLSGQALICLILGTSVLSCVPRLAAKSCEA